MELWVKFADVSPECDVFLKLGLLRAKIWLWKQGALAATISLPCFTFKPCTLRIQTSNRWPETTFTNDWLHALEPTWHCWMVIKKVKVLHLFIVTCSKCPRMHSWPILCQCPCFAWILGHLSSREGICSSFLMTRSIIKCKEASSKTICLYLEDVNCILDLLH